MTKPISPPPPHNLLHNTNERIRAEKRVSHPRPSEIEWNLDDPLLPFFLKNNAKRKPLIVAPSSSSRFRRFCALEHYSQRQRERERVLVGRNAKRFRGHFLPEALRALPLPPPPPSFGHLESKSWNRGWDRRGNGRMGLLESGRRLLRRRGGFRLPAKPRIPEVVYRGFFPNACMHACMHFRATHRVASIKILLKIPLPPPFSPPSREGSRFVEGRKGRCLFFYLSLFRSFLC